MSQAEPDFDETDRVHTLPVDEAGELARFSVSGAPGYSRKSLLELHIDHGGDPAAYELEFGSVDAEDSETIHWFSIPGDFSYPADAVVEDAWQQARRYVRIMVTEPAPSGSEARVLLAYGRGH